MKTPLKTTSLDKMIDDHIGKRGTQKRQMFESELKIELAGRAGKQARQKRK
jgi:HTH-type transcriptional regulator/antitoxin HipB